MNRISECDIYIDHQAYELGGQPYGEFGIAALEAAAMGKIVVSCTGKQKRYEKENGKIGMLVSNSPEELKSTLVSLVTKEDRQLHKIRKQCRFWVERYHSYRYIGKKTESFYARLLEEKRK
jgi:glycosyltransferase involved in cell wall biosynthesis